jgi:predicted transcriptional regulator
MSRFNEIEAALVGRLRTLKAKPDMTINLFEIGIPLKASGFSQDEIIEVLAALEQDGIVALVPGNRLRMLKALPD